MEEGTVKTRRTVTISHRVPRGFSSGSTKLWAYGVNDLGALFGMKPAAVRAAISRKAFDPASLNSILSYKAYRDHRKNRQDQAE